MANRIQIGDWSSKKCATCMYWQGGDVVRKDERTANSRTFIIETAAMFTRGRCTRNNALKSGTNSCGNHEFHYRFTPYL